jgi:Trypsin-co-occurring domain 2
LPSSDASRRRGDTFGKGEEKGGAVEDDDDGVELGEAIEALREALVRAWWDGRNSRVRFRVEPVELTVQVGVTRTGKGTAGIRWNVLALGGERSRERAVTQTLKLRLAPLVFDDQGNVLAESEQFVSDKEGWPSPDSRDDLLQDRE